MPDIEMRVSRTTATEEKLSKTLLGAPRSSSISEIFQ
jgi:hypothetical protein